MAYFACKKAARTGTDKRTRASIARGLVSGTFRNRKTGKTGMRGVVQLDAISGRDLGYATADNLRDRLSSAYGSKRGKAKVTRASIGKTTPPATTSSSLHSGSSGTISPATGTMFPKKLILMGVVVVAAVGLFLSRR